MHVVEPTYAKAITNVDSVLRITGNQIAGKTDITTKREITASDIAAALQLSGVYQFRVCSVIFSTGLGPTGNEAPEAVLALGRSLTTYVNNDQNKACKVRMPKDDPGGAWYRLAESGSVINTYTGGTASGDIITAFPGCDLDYIIVAVRYQNNLN